MEGTETFRTHISKKKFLQDKGDEEKIIVRVKVIYNSVQLLNIMQIVFQDFE